MKKCFQHYMNKILVLLGLRKAKDSRWLYASHLVDHRNAMKDWKWVQGDSLKTRPYFYSYSPFWGGIPGFIAGTLIQTQSGLKPIEQIRAGDWVLSSANNKGPASYKQVMEAFMYPYLPVWFVGIARRSETGTAEGPANTLWIALSGHQPVYVEDGAWLMAHDLRVGMKLTLIDGEPANVIAINPVYATRDPDTAWIPATGRRLLNPGPGYRVSFSYRSLRVEAAPRPPQKPRVFEKLKVRVVYNLRIQDNHTYFVGELGLPAMDFPESLAQKIIVYAGRRHDDSMLLRQATRRRAARIATKAVKKNIRDPEGQPPTVVEYPDSVVEEIISAAAQLDGFRTSADTPGPISPPGSP